MWSLFTAGVTKVRRLNDNLPIFLGLAAKDMFEPRINGFVMAKVFEPFGAHVGRTNLHSVSVGFGALVHDCVDETFAQVRLSLVFGHISKPNALGVLAKGA
jgi:hypothetical protein